MRLLSLAALTFLLTACQSPQPIQRTPEEETMFGPVAMHLHRTFTQLKSWTGDSRPDGVEAVLEFDDAFGEPAKAAGTVIFELFDFRKGYADPRGARLVNPWSASLTTFDEQQAHWHREYGAYSFLLADPDIRSDRNYVLTATFESVSGKRLADQTILIGQKSTRKKSTTSPDQSSENSQEQPSDPSNTPPDRTPQP